MYRSVLAACVPIVLSPVFVCRRLAAVRGPDRQGHSASKNVPLTWSETENITWKMPLPGLGWSSPSIREQQIWVTTAVDDGHSLRLSRRSRERTDSARRRGIPTQNPRSIHPINTTRRPHSVIEDERVYVHFVAHGTACLATDGRLVWKTQELKYHHQHGPGGSPVIGKTCCSSIVMEPTCNTSWAGQAYRQNPLDAPASAHQRGTQDGQIRSAIA